MLDVTKIIENTRQFTLLYVEDNDEAREATKMVFEELFDNIMIATNGQEGLDMFKQHQDNIDLIITDINMPVMDGLDMSRSIKQLDESIPIILLTALTDIVTLKKAIDIGVESFINKPLDDINILLTKLNDIVKKLNYEHAQKAKEKAILVLDMVKQLSHHWRQPLSTISIIASQVSFKLDQDIPITNDDLKNISKIPDKVEELSKMFIKVEELDFENISLKDIEDIVYISNKLC